MWACWRYLLYPLSTVIDKCSLGLYREEELAAIIKANGPKLDRITNIIALFKEGLPIITKIILIETGFLDMTLNLAAKKCFPFWKANNTTLYINNFSNHLPTIIKQLPKMINKKISNLFCNKQVLNKVKSAYKSALKKSGHFSPMSYSNSNTQKEVIWFNPAYS